MRIFLVNGSPRITGDTNALLAGLDRSFQDQGERPRLVHAVTLLEGLTTPYCVNCSTRCEGTCYRGSGLEAFFDDLAGADALVVASPVHFGTVAAPLKGLWDLSRKLRLERGLLYTVGAALAVGAGHYGGQETTIRAIHDMMLIQGMILVGDSRRESVGHQGVGAESGDDAPARSRLDHLAGAVLAVAGATTGLRRRSPIK
ncbi:MAG: flavodoxin family protein [bacterium]|nr:flavodoxin family protein [bacterium]